MHTLMQQLVTVHCEKAKKKQAKHWEEVARHVQKKKAEEEKRMQSMCHCVRGFMLSLAWKRNIRQRNQRLPRMNH